MPPDKHTHTHTVSFLSCFLVEETKFTNKKTIRPQIRSIFKFRDRLFFFGFFFKGGGIGGVLSHSLQFVSRRRRREKRLELKTWRSAKADVRPTTVQSSNDCQRKGGARHAPSGMLPTCNSRSTHASLYSVCACVRRCI